MDDINYKVDNIMKERADEADKAAAQREIGIAEALVAAAG